MKNKVWVILIILLTVIAGFAIYFEFNNNDNNNGDYEAQKTSTNENNNTNISNNIPDNTTNTIAEENNVSNETNTSQNQTSNETKEKKKEYKEEKLATFSTKIYSSDSARQNNIRITCNKLNNTTVKNGATFSFCNTVGKSTSAKGYQEADVYDHDGNKTKGLGGGNCQVSSTLYNAILKVSSLKVTERHAHSNHVPYVEKGKDAAVAYGSYDLKFVNNSGSTIKIKASTDGKSVTINIVSLKEI